ncbi:MAG: DUF2924 domain-containing protein [Candidatus Omnitrophota bacterium]|jgi:hypothetical protein
MQENLLTKIMNLKDASLEELKKKYLELFESKPVPSNNKTYLWKKIAYKLQEIEYGGLSTEAQGKIQGLIQKYDPVNNKAMRPEDTSQDQPKKTNLRRDKRLPIPGTVITKEYKGIKLQIKILESGFEYSSKVYKTLTAIAKEVTGAHWNGYLFFNL